MSGVAATSIRWKGDASKDDGDSEQAEGPPSESLRGGTKTPRSCESGKSRARR